MKTEGCKNLWPDTQQFRSDLNNWKMILKTWIQFNLINYLVSYNDVALIQDLFNMRKSFPVHLILPLIDNTHFWLRFEECEWLDHNGISYCLFSHDFIDDIHCQNLRSVSIFADWNEIGFCSIFDGSFHIWRKFLELSNNCFICGFCVGDNCFSYGSDLLNWR